MVRVVYLAGGCFWGVEDHFMGLPGIIKTRVGYANSNVPNPTYEQVCSSATGAAEAVAITYDPDIITLSAILTKFFNIVDPTQLNRQGPDVGTQYRNGVYFEDECEEQTIK